MVRWLTILLAIALVVGTHLRLDNVIKANEKAMRQQQFLPSLEAVKLVSGGFDRMASDLYWLGFVQYCGEIESKRGEDYSHAYQYVDLITGLDPYFIKPYWFGCWAVGYWQKRPDLAAKILQRGMTYNPQTWEFPYLAGINEYLFAKNYKLAAHYYRVAAKLPGAPDFLNRHAAILESPVPELVKRTHTLYQMFYDAKDPNYKDAVYSELLSALEEIRNAAPTAVTRQAAQKQIDDLKKSYEVWLESQ